MSKSVRHSHRGLRKGFTALPNEVLLDEQLSVGAKVTYALMTHFAWAADGEWPGQDGLAKLLDITPKALRTHMAALKTAALLDVERHGQGRPNSYVVHLPGDKAAEGTTQNGQNDRSGTVDTTGPEQAKKTVPLNEGEKTTAEDTPLPPAGGNVTKFRGKQVPLDVYCTSVALLDTFNLLAGTTYAALTGNGRPTEGLKRIMGAILDQPAITLDLGERMIRIQLADPYWQGKPQPGNVFGPGVVERNFEAAAWTATAAGKPSSARSFVERLDAKRKSAA